jgi:dUTP pyrophosphatase
MSQIIEIKRFDPALPLPEYKTVGAAGFDLAARETVTIQAQGYARVPLNVALALPDGYWVLLAARGSLHKRGLIPVNAVGIMDHDFRGDNDEYMAVLFNFTNESVTVEKGDRIMQGVLLPIAQLPFKEVTELGVSRGGFGSTGSN